MGAVAKQKCLRQGSFPVPRRIPSAAAYGGLPAAGNRNGSNFNNAGDNGNYWSSTPNDSENANYLNFNSNNVNPQNNNNRYNGYSVRLAQTPSQDALLAELFLSYYAARSGKRNTWAQVHFERNLIPNLMQLYREIVSRTYRVGRSMCFIIERPVKREVFAASFRDRIVHHLLYRYLAPVFEPRFIHDSYSCREGKGTLFGIRRLEHHIRSASCNHTRPAWVLKLDLLGYFMHIDRARLYDIVLTGLRSRGKHLEADFPVMEHLLRQVIFNDPVRGCYRKGAIRSWNGLPPSKSLFHAREGCGLPIGNLTSQLFSNIYLNEFDHFVKRELHCRHYGRYVDDFFVVGTDPQCLLALIPRLAAFLDARLGLSIHPRKIVLRRVSEGVPFLGAYIKPGRHYPCRDSAARMREHLALAFAHEPDPYRLRAILHSCRGHLAHFRSS